MLKRQQQGASVSDPALVKAVRHACRAANQPMELARTSHPPDSYCNARLRRFYRCMTRRSGGGNEEDHLSPSVGRCRDLITDSSDISFMRPSAYNASRLDRRETPRESTNQLHQISRRFEISIETAWGDLNFLRRPTPLSWLVCQLVIEGSLVSPRPRRAALPHRSLALSIWRRSALEPRLTHRPAFIELPASASRNIPIISSSLNRLLFICSFSSRTSVMSRLAFGVQASVSSEW
jgi:hypothetical protein